MKIITIDTETSCYNKGNFKDRRNNLVTFQYKYLGEDAVVIRTLRTNKREEVQKVISDADMLVGFNIKFDLHWLRNYGIDISGIRVWDCQLAEYLLESQQNPYNSLNDALQKYGLDLKPDTVKEEYWIKGVNTDDIPEEILNEYGKYDVEGTEEVFKKQREQFKNEAKGRLPLLKLQNADLLVLEDIEYNGVCFDTKAAVAYSRDVEDRCVEVIKRIHEIINIPEGCEFNISSNDHLSAVIYGGVITTTIRTPNGVFATGAKVGQVKYSLSKVEHSFPQLAVPNPKKETKKSKLGDGSKQSWSVAEDVLLSLRVRGVAKELITLVLEHSKLEKLIGTYLQGYTALIEEMNWPKDMLYSNLNQCTAVTGRLSSTRPNAQNANPETKKFMGSRYKDGVLLNYDVKGLEVVAAAYLSQDPILMKELEDGVDIHTANQEAFNLPSRLVAKILKFRLVYGATEYSFAQDPDFTSVSTSNKYWAKVIEKYYEKYAGISAWHQRLVDEVCNIGYITTPTGRTLKFDLSSGTIPLTMIKNHPVQSLGADIVSILRVDLHKRIKNSGVKCEMINTVHDSIVFDLSDKNDVDKVAEMTYNVLNDFPTNFKKVFGKDFNLSISGEIGVGVNLHDLVKLERV